MLFVTFFSNITHLLSISLNHSLSYSSTHAFMKNTRLCDFSCIYQHHLLMDSHAHYCGLNHALRIYKRIYTHVHIFMYVYVCILKMAIVSSPRTRPTIPYQNQMPERLRVPLEGHCCPNTSGTKAEDQDGSWRHGSADMWGGQKCSACAIIY